MSAFVRLIDEEQKRREEERLQQGLPQEPLLTLVPLSIYQARRAPVSWRQKFRKPTRRHQIVMWRTLTFISLSALLLHLCRDPLAKGFMVVFGLTALSLLLAYLWQSKEDKQRLCNGSRETK